MKTNKNREDDGRWEGNNFLEDEKRTMSSHSFTEHQELTPKCLWEGESRRSRAAVVRVPRRLGAGGTRYLSESGSASGAENSELFGSVNKEQFGPGVSWCPLPQFL